MLQLAGTLLAAISMILTAAALAAVIAALTRNRTALRTCARVAGFSALGLIPAGGLLALGATSEPPADSDVSKATMLAKGISEGMNGAPILLVLLLAATIYWLVAKRSVR